MCRLICHALIVRSGKPFDRHDWIIVREGDEQVRYVIDYYHDENNMVQEKNLPSGTQSNISVNLRPAVDSVGSFIDRIKFPIYKTFSKNEINRMVKPEESHKDKQIPSTNNTLSAEEVGKTFEKVQSSCHHLLKKLDSCQSEIECFQSAAALQICLANIICPAKAQSLSEALKTQDESKIESAFDAVRSSLDEYEARSAHVLREQAIHEAKTSRRLQ